MTLQLKSHTITLCSVFVWFGIHVGKRHVADLQEGADVEPTVGACPFQQQCVLHNSCPQASLIEQQR